MEEEQNATVHGLALVCACCLARFVSLISLSIAIMQWHACGIRKFLIRFLKFWPLRYMYLRNTYLTNIIYTMQTFQLPDKCSLMSGSPQPCIAVYYATIATIWCSRSILLHIRPVKASVYAMFFIVSLAAPYPRFWCLRQSHELVCN